MKVCPECNNVIRRNKSECPYCGHKFSRLEFIGNATWQLLILAIIIVVGALILINFWGI